MRAATASVSVQIGSFQQTRRCVLTRKIPQLEKENVGVKTCKDFLH
jgi:hypothetical protein